MRFSAIVGEVMNSNVKKVQLGESIENAARIMRDEKIGSVVVTGDKNVKGIVTTSDIVYKHVAPRSGATVDDIMTTQLITIEPHETIEKAANMMVKNGIEKILVMDEGRLVGIITNNDIIRVEPGLLEVLLEKMKLSSGPMSKTNEPGEIDTCESCGNYSDNLSSVDGVYMCPECRQ